MSSISDISRLNDLSSNTAFEAVRTANDEMNKEMFLKLLVAQMRYQDPLEPMDNSQMLAQLAQFSALEQMTNVATVIQTLNNNMVYFTQQSSLLQGAAMIGKHVIGLDVDGQTWLYGEVEAVRWLDGDPKLMIRQEDGTLKELEIFFVTHVQDGPFDPDNLPIPKEEAGENDDEDHLTTVGTDPPASGGEDDEANNITV